MERPRVFVIEIVLALTSLLLVYGIREGLPRTPASIALGVVFLTSALVAKTADPPPWRDALKDAGFQPRSRSRVQRLLGRGVRASTVIADREVEFSDCSSLSAARVRFRFRTGPTDRFPETSLMLAQPLQAAPAEDAEGGPEDVMIVHETAPAFARALLTPTARSAADLLLRTVGSEPLRNAVLLDREGVTLEVVVGVNTKDGAEILAEPRATDLRLLVRALCALADEAERALATTALEPRPTA